MITIILFALVGLIICICIGVFKSMFDSVAYFLQSLFCLLSIVMSCSLLGFLVAYAIPTKVEIDYDNVEVVDVFNIEYHTEIGGTFILGNGYINNGIAYTFYYKSNGGYKCCTLSANNTLIRYGTTPICEQYKYIPTKDIINYFSLYIPSYYDEYCNIIYVPEGSIKNIYNLTSK